MEMQSQSAGDPAASSSAAVRTGEITIRAIVDRYMAEYAGRDTTRGSRLGWWCTRLGSVTLAELTDDQVFFALQAWPRNVATAGRASTPTAGPSTTTKPQPEHEHAKTRNPTMPRLAIHPGEHLAEQLHDLEMSAAEFARRIDVPTNRVTELMHGKRAVTADTALRLARAFSTSARFWMNLQNIYDLRVAEAATAKKITKIAPVTAAAPRPAKRTVDKRAH